MKNGTRNGVQLYVCRDCGYQFRNVRTVPDSKIWELYMSNKQTIAELSASFGRGRETYPLANNETKVFKTKSRIALMFFKAMRLWHFYGLAQWLVPGM